MIAQAHLVLIDDSLNQMEVRQVTPHDIDPVFYSQGGQSTESGFVAQHTDHLCAAVGKGSRQPGAHEAPRAGYQDSVISSESA
jgi:hypothetical protein